MNKPQLTFIVPCYNEVDRLIFTKEVFEDFFKTEESRAVYNVLFIDDGSTDNTAEVLGTICESLNENNDGIANKISLKKNQGKGAALREGIKNANSEWCLTIDADMAARPHELISWIKNYNVNLEKPDIVFIGSREKGIDDHIVESSWIRRNIGLVFNKLLQKITGLTFRDTQCGFKMYPTKVAKEAFENLTDYGFAHDVEVLLKLQSMNINIKTLPLHWEEKEGSKVNLISDSLKMLRTIISIRNKYN